MKQVDQTSPEENQVKVNIQAQYVKKVSFDSPSVPSIFAKMKEAPKVDLDLDVQVKDMEKDQYEVTIAVKAKALKDVETVFTVNLEYSGMFEIKDAKDEDQKKQILLIYCPNLIFPFARRIISDVTRDGGFQPLMVNPVDFAGLYMQQQKSQEQNNEQKTQATVH